MSRFPPSSYPKQLHRHVTKSRLFYPGNSLNGSKPPGIYQGRNNSLIIAPRHNSTSNSSSSSSSSSSSTMKSTATAVVSKNSTSNNASHNPHSPVVTIFSNASLVLMGMAYMNQDIDNLRPLAMGSLVMSMIAQYQLRNFRMLQWHALFLGINTAWILKPLFTNETMNDDIQEVYHVLESKGNFLKQDDARQLFVKGKKQILKRGDFLYSEDLPSCNNKIYFIQSGKGVLVKKGFLLGTIEEGDFVHNGDMSPWAKTTTNPNNSTSDNGTTIPFLSSHTNQEKKPEDNGSHWFSDHEPSHQPQPHNDISDSCPTSVMVDSDFMVIWTWDHDEIQGMDPSVKDALLAYMYIGTQERLQKAWIEKIQNDEEMARLQRMATEYLFDGVLVSKQGNAGPTT